MAAMHGNPTSSSHAPRAGLAGPEAESRPAVHFWNPANLAETVTPRNACATICGLLVIGLALSLAGCGYMVGPPYSAEIRTVHVPTFKNETFRRGLEYQLTEAVQRQIQTRTPFQLAKEQYADTRLTGRIVGADKAVLGETHQDDARELQFSLLVELTWEDLRTRQILRRQNVPVPVDLVQQRTQSEFAVETGQSLATAEQQAMDRMARQIVDLMEDPW